MILAMLAVVGPHGNSGHNSNTGLIIFGVALIVIGGLHALKPDLTWRMSRWQYRDKNAMQPSNAALIGLRITGTLAAVAGVVLLIIGASR